MKFFKSLCSAVLLGQSPRDLELDDDGTEYSSAVRRMMAIGGSEGSFEQGRQQSADLVGLEVTTKAVERQAEAIGENTTQAYADRGLNDSSPLRIAASTHATLYALDAETGKELYSSGDQIASFAHFGGLSVANGRVYLGTFDSVLYCFGLPAR